ncbi:MAG: hypothetical protein AAFU73_20395 [Planctomycetota bacterium]
MRASSPLRLSAAALGVTLAACAANESSGVEGAGEPAPARVDTSDESRTVELGAVDWRRVEEDGDFEAALAEAGRVDRPVLLLFQEIPG